MEVVFSSIFFFPFKQFVFISVMCMRVSMCLGTWVQCPDARRGCWFHGAKFVGSCKPPCVDSGNCKSKMPTLLNIKLSLQPIHFLSNIREQRKDRFIEYEILSSYKAKHVTYLKYFKIWSMIKIVFAKWGEEKGGPCMHPTNHEPAAPQYVSYCCSLGLHRPRGPCLKHVFSSTWC